MTQQEELKPCPFCGSAAEDGMGYNYHKVCCSSLACRMSNMYFTKKEWNMRAKAQAVPEGWKLVPVEPTGEQWGGIARDIIFWLRSDSHQTPESLIEFLRNMGNEIPSWLTDEPEMKNANHVISKGTLAAIIYKAMLSAVPERPE